MSSNQTSTPRQHASTGPTLPLLPEPSHAERVRTLMSLTSVATLSTLSRKHPGFPFGSLMPFALDSSGRPIFLISNMAMHTQNLKTDPRCSLFVGQVGIDGDALGAARATIIGTADPVPENEIADIRDNYLARHENSRYWGRLRGFRLLPAPARRSLLRRWLWRDGVGRGARLRTCCPRPAGRGRAWNPRAYER